MKESVSERDNAETDKLCSHEYGNSKHLNNDWYIFTNVTTS